MVVIVSDLASLVAYEAQEILVDLAYMSDANREASIAETIERSRELSALAGRLQDGPASVEPRVALAVIGMLENELTVLEPPEHSVWVQAHIDAIEEQLSSL